MAIGAARRPRPFLSREVPAGDTVRRQEKALANRLGGKRQPGSGCGKRDDRKGDVAVDAKAAPIARGDLEQFLVESKTAFAASRRVTLAELQKIETQAGAIGKLPFLVLEFRPNGRERPGPDYGVVPMWVLKKLLGL